ncbi:small kinetochore-associated protein [Theropithecus gelada]|uniref:small kinetochore-associated protein n=1 Tax=Theropithecus gelada TaxID=9565 RepID=UPI000DC17B99|nr:small kinetochore-associated protein [Theropithecus gelada]
MAAPEPAPGDRMFRTTWLSTECDSHPLPPSYRKFPFETEAANLAGGATVASGHLLKESDKDCGQDRRAPGVQPCRLVTMTSVVKTVYSLQPASALSGGQPADTQTRATSKSLLPVRSKEVDVSKQLHSGGPENDVTKITKLRRENGQMKATDTTTRRNVRKGRVKPSGEEGLPVVSDLEMKILVVVVLLLETLQEELKLFNETAKKQMEELQALKVKLEMKEERVRFLEQQTLCNNQVNDLTTALKEMEQLLEM